MTQPEWDDDRLAEAFHGRFDRVAPDGLATSIHQAIAEIRPEPSSRVRVASNMWAGLAAAVMVLAVGAAVVGSQIIRSSGEPAASSPGPTNSAGVSAEPSTEAGLPTSVLGLDLITVSDALAVRDAGPDDRELAVAGWFTPVGPIPCPYPGELTSPIQLRCPDSEVWLTDEPESLIHRTVDGEFTKGPVSPAIHPYLGGLVTSWARPLQGIGDSVPLQVVFVGHFDDRRSGLCPAEERAACRDRFVVDQVASVDGVEQPLSHVTWIDSGPVRSTLDQILTVVAMESPDSPVLSVVTADDGSIRSVEPELTATSLGPDVHADPLIQLATTWVVRVLESDRAFTYAVRDGTEMIWEMTADGPSWVGGQIVESPTPAPEPPEGSVWPPDGSIVVELSSEVGGDDPVEVAVIDRSGRLMAAQEKGSVDPFFGLEGMAYAEPGFPGRVHLSWAGGVCDSHVVVTVAHDLRTITLDTGPRKGCDAMGVGRELVLDFSGLVDVPTIDIAMVPLLD